MNKILLITSDPIDNAKVTKVLKEDFAGSDWDEFDLGEGSPGELDMWLKQNVVDILIVDVENGLFSGLELMEHIREFSPWTKFVLLSDYDSVDFIYSTWKRGHCRILQKPVRENELKTALREIRAELERQFENRVPAENSMLSEFGVLFAMLTGDLDELDLQEYAKYANLPKKGNLIAIQLSSLYEKGGMRKIKSRSRLYHEIKNYVMEDRNCAVCPIMVNEIVCFVEARQEEENREAMLGVAEKLLSFLEKKYRLRVRIGIGRMVPLRKLVCSYDEAKRLLRESAGDKSIAYPEREGRVLASLEKELQELENMLTMEIKSGKMKTLDDFGRYLDLLEQVPLPIRRVRLLRFLSYVNYSSQDGTDRLRECFMDGESLLELLTEECWEAVGKWAYWSLFHILHMVRRGFSGKLFGLVAQGEEYLMESYQKEISLEDMAALFGITPQYFSKRFKEETGLGYTDWLNRYRIYRAKLLIRNTKLNIQEIGMQVGFPDSNYFSRTFKAMEKESPTNYAKAYRDPGQR